MKPTLIIQKQLENQEELLKVYLLEVERIKEEIKTLKNVLETLEEMN